MPSHIEGQIQLLVLRNLTDKSAKLGKIFVSPHSFIMPAQISHYFYNAVPSLSICKVLCFTGGAFVIKGLPEGGEFVIYEFLVFCYFNEGKSVTVKRTSMYQ